MARRKTGRYTRTALLFFACLFSLAVPVSAGDGTPGDTFSLAALVEVLARPGAARTGLALLGAIGVFRWRKRRHRGSVL
jgi:hypothetical protein